MVVVIATTSIPSEMNSTLKGAVLARKKELDLEQLWHEWFWLKLRTFCLRGMLIVIFISINNSLDP